MKNLLPILLYAAMLLPASSCRSEPVAEGPATLLLVYVAYTSDDAVPRIALGLEKPALKITAFEKWVTLPTGTPNVAGLAVQLKPEDTRTLSAAIQGMARSGSNDRPPLNLCFTTPDNKILDCMGSGGAEANILKAGVLYFSPSSESSIVAYLKDQLHAR